MLFDLSKYVKKYNLDCKEIAYIGANYGQEIINFNKLFNNPIIHLFEPQKKVYDDLCRKHKDFKNLKFYNIALGSSDKTAEIFINTNNLNQSSSMLEPKDHLKIHRDIEFYGTESIKVQKFASLKLDEVNFLNIDVQGYELEVLKGCEEYLKNVNFIVTEVNRKEVYKDCSLITDIDKFLSDNEFIRVHTSWWERTIPWGDALYIKKEKLSIIRIFYSLLKNKIQGIRGYFFVLALPTKLKKIFR